MLILPFLFLMAVDTLQRSAQVHVIYFLFMYIFRLAFIPHVDEPTAPPCLLVPTPVEVQVAELCRDMHRMQQIMLAMCEQIHTDLSHIDLGDLPYPTTGTGMSSLVANFNVLTIHRQSSGGSVALSAHSSVRSAHSSVRSAHSSVRSAHSSKFIDSLRVFLHANIYFKFVLDHKASQALVNLPRLTLRICRTSDSNAGQCTFGGCGIVFFWCTYIVGNELVCVLICWHFSENNKRVNYSAR